MFYFLTYTSLCCQCGTPTPPNPANICVACIRSQVDITEGIQKQAYLQFCKACERYLDFFPLTYSFFIFFLTVIFYNTIDSIVFFPLSYQDTHTSLSYIVFQKYNMIMNIFCIRSQELLILTPTQQSIFLENYDFLTAFLPILVDEYLKGFSPIKVYS